MVLVECQCVVFVECHLMIMERHRVVLVERECVVLVERERVMVMMLIYSCGEMRRVHFRVNRCRGRYEGYEEKKPCQRA